ncbi:MAG: four helix bundle protein [bacterium]|nr:four helix bundle protein [bacterium]
MKSRSYKDLIVWQKSSQLAKDIYELTNGFPRELASQMRRAAVSISSNIAEGSKRNTTKDFGRFLVMAQGSASELESQLRIAKSLPFGIQLDYSKVDSLLIEIIKMLYVLARKIGN